MVAGAAIFKQVCVVRACHFRRHHQRRMPFRHLFASEVISRHQAFRHAAGRQRVRTEYAPRHIIASCLCYRANNECAR